MRDPLHNQLPGRQPLPDFTDQAMAFVDGLRTNRKLPPPRVEDSENFGPGVLVPLEDFEFLGTLLTDEQKAQLTNFRHRRVRMEACPVTP